MRYTLQTRRSPRFVQYLLLLVAFAACQGQARVHEAPPASYPDETSAVTEPPATRPASPATDDRYAAPPAASGDWDGEASDPGRGEFEAGRDLDSGRNRSDSGPGAGGNEAKRAESSAPVGRGPAASAQPQSAARSRDDRRHRPLAPRPEDRPGLATHWGETRYSPTRQVDFERSDGPRPAAVVELHYNDRAGARRMLPGGQWGRAEARALGGVRISVVDASGRSFPALTSGSRLAFVGAPGERYALSLENTTGARFEVVASVDGLDVLDGESASFEKRGYLIEAYSSVIVDGFRRSDGEVAAFRLGDVAGSYAAGKGKARNVGVIGVALFAERGPVVVQPRAWRSPSHDDTELRREAEPFPGRYARPPVW